MSLELPQPDLLFLSDESEARQLRPTLHGFATPNYAGAAYSGHRGCRRFSMRSKRVSTLSVECTAGYSRAKFAPNIRQLTTPAIPDDDLQTISKQGDGMAT
jgi:hypothetical protein